MSFLALLCSLRPLPANQGRVIDEAQDRDGLLPELSQATRAQLLAHIPSLRQDSVGSDALIFAFIQDELPNLTLRVTVLGEAGLPSIPHLLQRLTQHPSLHLGKCWYTCDSTDLSHSAWAGLSTWADFLTPPYGHTIRLHLGTPLVLTKETAHFPSPRPLITRLAKLWHVLGGPPLPADIEPLLDNGSIVIADYRLQARRMLLGEQDQLGFRGWISYECLTKHVDAQAALTALARFAFFAGIGDLTQFGMGTTRIEIQHRL